jgi:hypothetical protein
MDRRAFTDKLKKVLPGKKGVMTLVTLAVVGGVGYPAAKFFFKQGKKVGEVAHEKHGEDVAEATHAAKGGVFQRITEKFYEIRRAEIENEKLRLENAHLRLKLEAEQFECSSKTASRATHELESALAKQTGSKIGRTLASIPYKPPGHLLPAQIHTLAVQYFRAGELEKAAVNLTFLSQLDDTDAYRNPKDYLMTGIAWYRLENFELADEFFSKVLAAPESPESQQWQAQARLWRALAAKRTNKRVESQSWLRELIDHHPQSTEAAWVNPSGKQSRVKRTQVQETQAQVKEEHREPASSKRDHESEDAHDPKHAH